MFQAQPLRLLQLTDTHLFATADQQMRGCTTAATLNAVLEKMAQLPTPPEALLLTGDLSQDETAASYERLRAMITPFQVPTYWIPGNHDRPSEMEAVLTADPWSTAKSFQAGNWNVVLLDSQLPDHTEGKLSADSLDWLDQQLQRHSDKFALVALHHPPCEIGSAWMDELSLTNPDDLLAVLDRHPQVRLVIFGHIHQEFVAQRGKVTFLGCPSTCIQFQPNQVNLAIDQTQPGFRWLELHPDGQINTQVVRIA